MPSVVGSDLSGTTLDGRFRLTRALGEGAMGQVYVAHHLALDRPVAVKVLHPWLAAQPKHRERFMREARAASRIKHPNVVEIVDFGTSSEDQVYLVMELLDGQDLKALLRRDGPLPWARARHYLLQAVAALREAHRHGIIHRDIKPANCFVCTSVEPQLPERMKLLDFGIAKLGEDPSASSTGNVGKRLTQTGELVGTLAYMAPEFAEGLPASVHTDMYALGIMAYELITGNVPFTGRNEFQVLARHLSEPPVRPRALVATLSEAAESVVLTLLAKKPELRFETMADVEQALLAIPADGSEGPIVVPRGSRESSGPALVRQHKSGLLSAAPPVARSPAGEVKAEAKAPPTAAGRSPPNGTPPNEAPAVDVQASWRMGESIDGLDVRVDEDDVPRPPRDWNTIITIVLLSLLLGAGIASVVMRQRGIEIPWPWSKPHVETPPTPAPSSAQSP
ncbi:serine/threonine-protein kinase [Paraliomyxa miuraensis]|uniref:serine/threonine-protein kinase n=1 Tax=Paraliomyxa miuraensis TaxID=376150 RepID=UPI00225098D9|nr:serine/threonine-protein kinase [Paraliomyxa miuraensis]MCX4241581.1 serine/threonine protein kinase [Paraliomyxa miuraensis]